jgi:hypothetical protein
LKKWPKKTLVPNDSAVPLHKRYPCNFSLKDVRKSSVGISESDGMAFVLHMKQLMKQEPWNNENPTNKDKLNGKKPQEPPFQPSSGRQNKASKVSSSNPQTTESTSQKPQHTWNSQHNAVPKKACAESNEDGEGPHKCKLLSGGLHIDDLKCALFDVDWEYALARSRAMDTEQKLLDVIRQRISQEERVKELESLCAELMSENKRLKGRSIAGESFQARPKADKRARCEDYFSEEEEERPEKRMRSEEWV